MGTGRIIYNLLFYVLAAIVLAASLYVAWRYVSSERNWSDMVEWNFWESNILYPILCILGFFLQFTMKHYTNITVITDSWGNKTYYEDNPGCFVELVSYLFIFPCLIGMVLYYAIMIPFSVISTFIPYLAAAASVGIAVLFFFVAKGYEDKSFSIVRLVFTVLFTLSILYAMALPTDLRIDGTTVTTEAGPKSLGKIKVIAQAANLRTGPGTKYSVCTRSDGSRLTAKRGEHYDVFAIEGRWYKVALPNGDAAYISKSLCTKLDSPDVTAKPVNHFRSGEKSQHTQQPTTSQKHIDIERMYFEEGVTREVNEGDRFELHLVVEPADHDEEIESIRWTKDANNQAVAVASKIDSRTYLVKTLQPGVCTISLTSSRTKESASFQVRVK